MAIGVHTNYAQIVAANTLNSTNTDFSKNMERLSTGYRINSASDDAAGLQIATRLNTETRGIAVAQRNAGDAISYLQTAEGAFDEMTNIAQRMHDLGIQSTNGTNGTTEQAAINAEFTELAKELDSIAKGTRFGGTSVLTDLNANAGIITFQLGTDTTVDSLQVDVTNGGASSALADILTAVDNTGGGALDGSATLDAATKIADVSTLLDNISEVRSTFGAAINRVDHRMTNLSNTSANLQAASGRIMDVDFATEGAAMSKNQMLMQSGAQMLSQTKMVPQLAMQLLG
ncbi:flagellin [Vibrio barjaei]|uniref:flagellin N-terminal helical domain-containing protein n=1 Tax=Vibrio barjaei TaxID=1676683 RepID=UPI002284FFE2|nr:flagellin [Vibrio barjaei]MCY9872300.1 flagellin [Vibrio barjaei]